MNASCVKFAPDDRTWKVLRLTTAVHVTELNRHRTVTVNVRDLVDRETNRVIQGYSEGPESVKFVVGKGGKATVIAVSDHDAEKLREAAAALTEVLASAKGSGATAHLAKPAAVEVLDMAKRYRRTIEPAVIIDLAGARIRIISTAMAGATAFQFSDRYGSSDTVTVGEDDTAKLVAAAVAYVRWYYEGGGRKHEKPAEF